MAALTKSVIRTRKTKPPEPTIAPAKAGVVLYVGAYLVREAASGLVVPGVDAAGVVPLGICMGLPPGVAAADRFSAHLDNTTGANGVLTGDTNERCVQIATKSCWSFAVTGAATPKIGDKAYLVNDNTVTADTPGAGLTSVNGIIAGRFDRPAPESGAWFVDIELRGIA